MQLKDWLPFLSVVVVVLGWLLSQLGQWFIARRDERKAIGRASKQSWLNLLFSGTCSNSASGGHNVCTVYDEEGRTRGPAPYTSTNPR